MTTSRALCSRSASCIGPITPLRQRRLSAALITTAREASRSIQDDAFASAFKSRRTSDASPPGSAAAKPILAAWKKPTRKAPQRARSGRFAVRDDERKTESAMDIFRSVVREKKDEKDEQDEQDEQVNEVRISDFSLTAILRQVTKNDMAPRKRTDFFFDHVWPEVKLQGRPLPKNLLLEVNDALTAVSNALLSDPGFKQVRYGDLTNIAKAYQWLGTNDVPAISGLITGLCFLMIKRPTSRASKMSNSGLAAMSPAIARNPELLQLWGHLTSMNRSSAFFESPDEDVELKIPSLADIVSIEQRLDRSAGVETALTAILNQFPANTAKQAFPALIATLTILLHDAPRVLLSRWIPLLDAARHILTEFPLEEALVRQRFAENLLIPAISQGTLARSVARRWAETNTMLTEPTPVWRVAKDERPLRRRPNVGVPRLFRDLRAAYESNNIRVMTGLWEEVKEYLERSDGNLAEDMRQNPDYLNYWYFVWCASKQSHMISETQALMKSLGLEPTIKTYTAMMHGWKMSRQTDKIDMLWDTLCKSGYQLDTYMWTERISGLIELGELQRGINTLAEMLALWKKAIEEGTSDKAAPVTITVINAAFKPLIRKDQQAAFKILQWAGNEGIKPDVVTYNVLLRECSRKPDSAKDIADLLKAMRDEGIEPDSATFTIILQSACRDLQHASAAEQVDAVNQVIQDMKNANVPLNLEVWGKLLYTIANLPSSSNAAIDCVLRHTHEAGFKQISPHMMHILIKRITEGTNPKPEAIETVLLDNGFRDMKTGDQRLWEEVISAYSILGDGRRAMTVYNELRQTGRKMSRQFANRDFLAALIKVGERDAAKSLVDDSLSNAQEEVINDRFFKHNFWNRAYEEGLVDWETAPPALRKAVDPRRLASGAIAEGVNM